MSHKNYRTEKTCLNCGTEVTKKFCPECGQENLETRENFFHLVGHFISDYFHFDSKFFRSLIPLFIRPGFLTKEYWQGRRVHYIHPLRLFFFITIIFMISTSLFYKHFGDEVKNRMISEKVTFAPADTTNAALNDPQKEEIVKNAKTKDTRMKTKFAHGIDNFFSYIKYITFFLLPVYALVFRVLYWRRRPFYVDQLVYMIHLQSFVYCLFSVALILPLFLPAVTTSLLSIVLIILFGYILVSLHKLYKQPIWKTIVKSVIATGSLFFITIWVMVIYTVIVAMNFG